MRRPRRPYAYNPAGGGGSRLWKLFLNHVQARTARIRNGRVRLRAMVVNVEDVMRERRQILEAERLQAGGVIGGLQVVDGRWWRRRWRLLRLLLLEAGALRDARPSGAARVQAGEALGDGGHRGHVVDGGIHRHDWRSAT